MFVTTPKLKFIIISFVISSVLVVLSLVLIFRILPDVITDEVYKNVKLYRGTEQYDRFLELPFPVAFKVYFFNIENPSDIIEGKKPVVKEVGPYVYKQYRKKVINSTDDAMDTISYIQIEKFEFDNESSGNLSDEDLISTLNTPMMSILQLADNYGQTSLLSNCLKDLFSGLDSVFVEVKVKDLLFDGIRFCTPHLSLCQITNAVACKLAGTKKNVDKMEDGSLKFSYFNYKSSPDGLYTVKRGIKDIQSLGSIVTLNNKKYTKFWKRLEENSTCDRVKGTDSTLYPPQITKDSVIEIYSTDICRSIEINFSREVVYKGIEGYMFTTDNSTLRSNKTNTEEDCFCAKQTKGVDGKDSCFLDGVMDLQPCTGAPVLISFPHFLWADEFYINGSEGLSPNEEKHKTYLVIEPDTGTPLEGVNRIQINAILRPINKIKQTQNLPRVVLPLLWIEEGVSLTDEYVSKLEEMYFQKVTIVNISKWTFFGVSILLTILFGVFMICNRNVYITQTH